MSELPGRTVPYEVAEIRPQVGGIIIKRNFIEGDKVNQGDSLYQIDPAPLQAELNSAKGTLAKALSTASNARITFNRQASLLKTNYVSRQDYDTARTQLNEAEATSPSPKRLLNRRRSICNTRMSPRRLRASAGNRR